MNRNKLNRFIIHKLLPILALFLLVTNTFVVYSFGAEKNVINFHEKDLDKDITVYLPQGYGTSYKYYMVGFEFSAVHRNFTGVSVILSNSPIFYNGEKYTLQNSSEELYYISFSSNYSSISLVPTEFDFSDKSVSDCIILKSPFFFSGLVPECLVYSNHSILDINTNDVVFEDTSPKPSFIIPSFINSKGDLETGKFDTLQIDAGDFDYSDDEFVLNIYNGTYISDNVYNYSLYKSILLNSKSSYLYVSNLNLYYYIPREKLGIDISNDKTYLFELKEKSGDTVYSSIDFTISGLTTDEEIQNSQDETNQKLDEQTNAIKEQTETNKNIFEKIGEVLSYINPFSENFFVYKLIELLLEALKSLFVPGENFFINWINDLNSYFGDRFGIIYYPFELLIEVLTRIAGITGNYTSAVISFGDLKLFDTVLIPAFSFDFFSLLTNDTLKNIHNIYLVCVDVILYLGLVLLAKNTFSEIFGGHFVDEVISDTTADDRSYSNYERYQNNRQRYKSEHGGTSK